MKQAKITSSAENVCSACGQSLVNPDEPACPSSTRKESLNGAEPAHDAITASGLDSTCPDCGAAVGALHSPGCDVEPCPRCGGQAISCGCTYDSSRRMPWTGMWPGEEEARKFGWFAKSVPGNGWVQCAADDPGARPDINRLGEDARWDADSRQWVLK